MSDNLSQALLEAQKNVSRVEKDARNEYQGYDYASAEAIIGVAREALHEAGVLAYRSGWRVEHPEGSDSARVEMSFVLSHPNSGETQTYTEVAWPAIPGRGRPMDKAIAAALTSCWAYWLRDLLLIPRANEDIEARDDGEHTTASSPSDVTVQGVTGDQLEKIEDLVKEAGSDKAEIAKYFKVDNLTHLSQDQAERVIQLLMKKIPQDGGQDVGAEGESSG